MKKHFASLSLAMTVALSAAAAQPAVSTMQRFQPEVKAQPLSQDFVMPKSQVEAYKAAAKAPSKADFLHEYTWEYNGRLSNSPGWNTWGNSVRIVQSEEYPDSVDIMGIVDFEGQTDSSGNPIRCKQLRGAINDKGELIIPTQPIYFHPTENKWIFFRVFDWVVAEVEDGGFSWDPAGPKPSKNPAVGVFNEDLSTISFGEQADNVYVGMNTVLLGMAESGDDISGFYFFLNAFNTWHAILPFEFVASEWKQVGKAEFDDGWLNPRFFMNQGGHTDLWEVNIYRGTTESNRYDFLIENPYGDQTPYGQTAVNKAGYLIFNPTFPDCVPFKPFVLSTDQHIVYEDGMTEDQTYYCYNLEGYLHYIGNTEIEEVYGMIVREGKKTSELLDRTLTVRNCIFGINGNMGGTFSWIDKDNNPVEMITVIDFDDDATDSIKEAIQTYDPEGIESVITDSNAAAQYFNLQGVRVANPEKGQLVIVREGNKAKKVVF